MDKQERERLRDLTYRRDHAHRRLANLNRETTPRNEIDSANRELDHACWSLQNALDTETIRRLLDALDAVETACREGWRHAKECDDGRKEAEQRAEAAERDAGRYRWVLPIVTAGADCDARTLAVALALFRGLDGDAAIDAAMGEQTGEGGAHG